MPTHGPNTSRGALIITGSYRLLTLFFLPYAFLYLTMSLWDWHAYAKWPAPLLVTAAWALLIWTHAAGFRQSRYLFFPAPPAWWPAWPIRARVPLFLLVGALMVFSLPISGYLTFFFACLLQFYLLSSLTAAWFPRADRRSRGVPVRGAGLLLAIGLLLLTAEGMNRTWWFGIFRPDATAGVALRQNDWYGVNADGYRGPRLTAAPAPGVRRLLFLGDSSTFGFGLPADQAFARLTAACLARSGAGKFEEINGGIPGYNLLQTEIAWQRLRGLAPRAVVAMVGYHHESLGRFLARQSSAAQGAGWLARLFAGSEKIGLTLPTTVGMLSQSWRIWGSESPDQAADREIFRQTLERLIATIAGEGLPLVLVAYPSPQIDPEVAQQIEETAAAHQLPWIDLRPEFFNAAPPLLQQDELHPNAAGHRAIAAALCRHFQAHPIP
ncbi:MAG: SGNH/GDSL hydrolase family protein [Myxococcales bacterium]|nr:SGNH/GDSL hydrolase family protein [Myxococcales bacterium]